jgi:hypothetical protein
VRIPQADLESYLRRLDEQRHQQPA